MLVPFEKMQGAGNDFVIVRRADLGGEDGSTDLGKLARSMCDRHFGVGADQMLLVETGDDPNAFFMHTFNADGSAAGICGNGLRCVAAMLHKSYAPGPVFAIGTPVGRREVRIDSSEVFVDMGVPHFDFAALPAVVDENSIEANGWVRMALPGVGSFSARLVSMGNPHCVIFLQDEDFSALSVIGPAFENHAFFPQRVNVELAYVVDNARIRAEVWERGAGVTLACGSGAGAVAAAAIREGWVKAPVQVAMPGGTLTIDWQRGDVPAGEKLWMTGPVEQVFTGQYSFNP